MLQRRKKQPMADFINEKISNIRIIGSAKEYSGMRMLNSKFTGCTIAQFDDPKMTLKVRNVEVERCQLDRCTVQQVFFEEMSVDTVEMAQVQRLYGCVFRHVTLRGKIGPIVTMGPHSGLVNRQDYIAGIVDSYNSVDWALDIRDAEFSDASFYYVPGHLVRYDNDTQILLRREKFAEVNRSELPSYANIWAGRFNETPFDSFIAVAPKRSKNFRKYMENIDWLHNAGLAG
jgi:hypothetical protein